MEWIWVYFVIGMLVLYVLHHDIKTRLARVERKLNHVLRESGIDPTQGLPISDRVKDLARDPSKKIEAIKVYREETGAGLAEAKEAVENYINSL